ncbi:hypothetical protein [Dethiothermospora halolimnae]|uniref:hypothetical protein n=1 Tax=Dethiothermospora halolimnae TaxID=3114390 RepID=UPI003CCB9673
MKSRKKIVSIVILIVVITLVIGCNDETGKVYSDENEISAKYDTFSLDEDSETIEQGKYKGTFKLSGMGTIWKYQSDDDINLEVPYKFSVQKGKAKLVLISPDDTIVNLIEITNSSSEKKEKSLTLPIKKGLNRMKVVGHDKASIDMEIQIDKGSFKKIGF